MAQVNTLRALSEIGADRWRTAVAVVPWVRLARLKGCCFGGPCNIKIPRVGVLRLTVVSMRVFAWRWGPVIALRVSVTTFWCDVAWHATLSF